jgi:osmotically-inducible protein OsmY
MTNNEQELNKNHKKTKRELYEAFDHDSVENESLMGHGPEEFDEGLALNYHDDEYHEDSFGYIRTDEELEVAVKELLKNSIRLDSSDITVTVDKCNVTLSGSVKSQEDRDYALEVVRLVHGVGDIHTEIIVKRNEGILPTDIGRHA